MLARLALLFVVVPLVELALLIQLGQWFGLWPTIGLVVATGVLGASVARAEGLRALRAFQSELGAGRLPGQPIFDGLSVLVGGAFLLTPGLLTDVVGFSLLVPWTRRLIQGRVRGRFEEQLRSGQVQVRVWSPGMDPTRGPYAGTSGDGGTGLDPEHEIRVDDVEGG